MTPKKKILEKTAQAGDTQLRDYELVVVISPEVADEALDTAIDNTSQFITGKGGIISNVERWGKRKLAYPIRHFVEGNYVLTQFQSRPELGKELEANLEISEDVLRHLLIKIE